MKNQANENRIPGTKADCNKSGRAIHALTASGIHSRNCELAHTDVRAGELA